MLKRRPPTFSLGTRSNSRASEEKAMDGKKRAGILRPAQTRHQLRVAEGTSRQPDSDLDHTAPYLEPASSTLEAMFTTAI